jgi:hypothetical protein
MVERGTAEVAAKAAPEAADMAPSEPADMAAPKPAASTDEVTANPSHVTATKSSAVASSAPSAARRRHFGRCSGQGSRNGKDYDFAQHRILPASSPHRALTGRRQRQIRDPAVSSHESLLLRKRRYSRNKKMGLAQNKTNET